MKWIMNHSFAIVATIFVIAGGVSWWYLWVYSDALGNYRPPAEVRGYQPVRDPNDPLKVIEIKAIPPELPESSRKAIRGE